MSYGILQNPIFTEDEKARKWLEAQVWPSGLVCPHCGSIEKLTHLHGKAHCPGTSQCNACRKQFTVTVGTVCERSKIPRSKWLLGKFLLCVSKKRMSALQLSRMLGVSHQSTWFMVHRIREAMREVMVPGSLGGANKVVEVDETYHGRKAKNQKGWVPHKEPVVALVERDGCVHSFHVARPTADTLHAILVTQANRASPIMTDEARVYPRSASSSPVTARSTTRLSKTSAEPSDTRTRLKATSLSSSAGMGTYHSISQAFLKL